MSTSVFPCPPLHINLCSCGHWSRRLFDSSWCGFDWSSLSWSGGFGRSGISRRSGIVSWRRDSSFIGLLLPVKEDVEFRLDSGGKTLVDLLLCRNNSVSFTTSLYTQEQSVIVLIVHDLETRVHSPRRGRARP